jgi:hypothetical protein
MSLNPESLSAPRGARDHSSEEAALALDLSQRFPSEDVRRGTAP